MRWSLFLMGAEALVKKQQLKHLSMLRLLGARRKCVTVSETYAFGFTIPTGKLERKTSEKDRDTEKPLNSSVVTHSQVTWPWLPWVTSAAIGSQVDCSLQEIKG